MNVRRMSTTVCRTAAFALVLIGFGHTPKSQAKSQAQVSPVNTVVSDLQTSFRERRTKARHLVLQFDATTRKIRLYDVADFVLPENAAEMPRLKIQDVTNELTPQAVRFLQDHYALLKMRSLQPDKDPHQAGWKISMPDADRFAKALLKLHGQSRLNPSEFTVTSEMTRIDGVEFPPGILASLTDLLNCDVTKFGSKEGKTFLRSDRKLQKNEDPNLHFYRVFGNGNKIRVPGVQSIAGANLFFDSSHESSGITPLQYRQRVEALLFANKALEKVEHSLFASEYGFPVHGAFPIFSSMRSLRVDPKNENILEIEFSEGKYPQPQDQEKLPEAHAMTLVSATFFESIKAIAELVPGGEGRLFPVGSSAAHLLGKEEDERWSFEP